MDPLGLVVLQDIDRIIREQLGFDPSNPFPPGGGQSIDPRELLPNFEIAPPKNVWFDHYFSDEPGPFDVGLNPHLSGLFVNHAETARILRLAQSDINSTQECNTQLDDWMVDLGRYRANYGPVGELITSYLNETDDLTAIGNTWIRARGLCSSVRTCVDAVAPFDGGDRCASGPNSSPPKQTCTVETTRYNCIFILEIVDSFKDAKDPWDSFEGNQEFDGGTRYDIIGQFQFHKMFTKERTICNEN